MNKLQLIIALFLIANLNIFGQSNEWNSLNEKDFLIQYPDKWELNISTNRGNTLFRFSSLPSINDQFEENVTLFIQDLTEYNIDLNQYVEMSENMISQGMITDGNIISSNRTKTKDTEFQEVIYTGKQGVFNLKFMEYYWVQNNKAYVLTLRCQVNEFISFKDIWKKILNSFKIK